MTPIRFNFFDIFIYSAAVVAYQLTSNRLQVLLPLQGSLLMGYIIVLLILSDKGNRAKPVLIKTLIAAVWMSAGCIGMSYVLGWGMQLMQILLNMESKLIW